MSKIFVEVPRWDADGITGKAVIAQLCFTLVDGSRFPERGSTYLGDPLFSGMHPIKCQNGWAKSNVCPPVKRKARGGRSPPVVLRYMGKRLGGVVVALPDWENSGVVHHRNLVMSVTSSPLMDGTVSSGITIAFPTREQVRSFSSLTTMASCDVPSFETIDPLDTREITVGAQQVLYVIAQSLFRPASVAFITYIRQSPGATSHVSGIMELFPMVWMSDSRVTSKSAPVLYYSSGMSKDLVHGVPNLIPHRSKGFDSMDVCEADVAQIRHLSILSRLCLAGLVLCERDDSQSPSATAVVTANITRRKSGTAFGLSSRLLPSRRRDCLIGLWRNMDL